MAVMGTLNEDFQTLNASLWTSVPASFTVSGGALNMPASSAFNEISTGQSHTLTNSFASIKFTQFPNVGNGTTQVGFTVYKNGTNSIQIVRGGGNINVTYKSTGNSDVTTSLYPGYNDMAWRIRQVNTPTPWIYIESSIDGARWILRHSFASTVTWTNSSVKIYCWYYGTESNPGTGIVDWVSYPGPPNSRILSVGQAWNGKLKTAWQSDQSAYASSGSDANGPRITQGDIGGRTGVLKLFAMATDVSPLTPTANPRAQLNGPDLLEPEHVYEHTFDLYFPSATTYTGSWPASGDRWCQWVQLGYGFPYQGSGPVRLMSRSATTIGISEVDTQTWSTAMPLDTWCRFIFRQRMSKTRPWYELYYSANIDTTPVSLVIPRKKVATIDYSQDGGTARLIANTYFSAVLGQGVSKVGPIGLDNVKTKRLQDSFPVAG